MSKNYSNQNLQKASFTGEDLTEAFFVGSDIRGADFTGANLSNADLTGVKTGIAPLQKVLLFIAALIISLLSGYVAMLAGRTIQSMLASNDTNVQISGIATIVITILFIVYFYWKGGRKAFMHLVIPILIVSAAISIISYSTGLGTGIGMLYQILALGLIGIMFFVGTIARAAAGTLSNILFLVVALSGGMFGRSVGGGIGTVVVAIACMQISKRALSGAKGFEFLRRIAFFITTKYGTSFRGARLTDADFSGSTIQNADFTDADIFAVRWGDSRKINCLVNEKITTEKKRAYKQ